jgi:hypothetical protein
LYVLIIQECAKLANLDYLVMLIGPYEIGYLLEEF